MQFITRVLIVLAVLGGLGYGSYAFGKYVLSARLFGPQGNTTTTTAASTGGDPLQTPPDVEVEVLPVPQPTVNAGISDAPTREPQPSATPDERVEILPSQPDNDSSTRDSTRARTEPTPRPRRRRRRTRPTPRPQRKPRPTAVPQVQAPPARSQNVDPLSNDNSDSGSSNDAPRVETPRRDPVAAPTRRERERRTDPAPEPRAETPRFEAPRVRPTSRPARRRESSPVPVPEGALGGGNSSPVPVPG